MFLRLTDIHGDLILVNIEKICDISLGNFKGQIVPVVNFVGGFSRVVKETVSEISLLLQSGGKVVK